MRQVFTPRANAVAKLIVAAAVIAPLGLIGVSYAFTWSSFMTGVGQVREQPVPFSHEHHVRGLGLDCRVCHTSVEESAYAGLPASAVCMNCHSQIWANSPMLQPVRDSEKWDRPLRWTRVNDVPDFVFFNHSIHVAKGVGCSTCHGEVDRMPLTSQQRTLFMSWCLECHRDPTSHLRPKQRVFDMNYTAPVDQAALGRALSGEYQLRATGLTDCVTCHR